MIDFLSAYLAYTRDTESTATFHRWSAIVGVGAWLERNIWVQHGASRYFPNHYTMLLGESATRKSSAIKGFVRILRQAGYKTISAEKTSKEKFLQDLAMQHTSAGDDDTELNLWGSSSNHDGITPLLIAADEANDFFGINNLEFLSTLGSMWDKEGVYENKIKSGKSDFIPNPTISILSGNTPQNFSTAFPPAIIGQGFFSRILLIHGEITREKITWPSPPDLEATTAIVTMLQQMKLVMQGELKPTEGAMYIADAIYKSTTTGADPRFASYYNRRLTHLLKLSLVIAACKMQKSITEDTIIQANTYLTYIQNLMPKALGQYGKVENADVVQKVISIIYDSRLPVNLKDIWKHVDRDMKSQKELGEILQKLLFADKIQSIPGVGFLPVRTHMIDLGHVDSEYVDFSKYLTTEELGVKI